MKSGKVVLAGVMCIIMLLSFGLMDGHAADVYGQNIKWNPGIDGGIPQKSISVNVKDFGAKGDGVTDDYEAFNEAIKSVTAGEAVFIPEGNYLIKTKLSFDKPVVLRGEGTERTHLLVDHNSDAFEIITYKRGQWVKIEDGFTKGSTKLTVSNPELIKPGMYIEIQQDNDPEVMYTIPDWNTSWASGAVGQIAKIVSVEGSTVTIDEPLRIDYRAELNPVARTQGFAEYVGFEDFSVKRIDTSDTNMFYFKNAANCWIKNVHSMLARKAHVSVTTGYRIEVRDSFFEDATDWGGGGHGYGVELGFHVTDCLAENNIFKHLRHSMMTHIGANGNVFGYNYSIEPYQNEGGTWTPCDISIHGHYAYANLFEGNIVQEVTIGDYWGPAGPGNTFLRNRIEKEGITVEDSSNYQNFIGNELVSGNILWDTDSRYPHRIDSSTFLRHGNYMEGNIEWDLNISDKSFPKSYYMSDKPKFYNSLHWPSTGSDILDGTNPARERYLGNTIPDTQITYGDVHGDGAVNSIDFGVMRMYLLGMIDKFTSEKCFVQGDVNGDGNVNSIDFGFMRMFLLGTIDEFPAKEK
ncbi:dockerin type I domain-containing protein [Acetivibrio cellulolyticus]|uniref:dockerin type I domain-containing protein n=1 Tax=Acetivibrio cellulolyticus TaxID=35830 RepID=UPI0001E2F5FB|nr:glycosyl hydrolase family 28-related protein [Acetivibrio cellulolyticus]